MENELINAALKTDNPIIIILSILCTVLALSIAGLFVYYRADIAKKDKVLEKRFDQVAGLTDKVSTAISGITHEIDRLVDIFKRGSPPV